MKSPIFIMRKPDGTEAALYHGETYPVEWLLLETVDPARYILHLRKQLADHVGDANKKVEQPAGEQVPECPFPCGWVNLYSRIVTDAAFLSRGLVEDEPVTEQQRSVVMHMIATAKTLCERAMLAAAQAAPAAQEAVAEVEWDAESDETGRWRRAKLNSAGMRLPNGAKLYAAPAEQDADAKDAQIAELRCDMHGAEEARIAAEKQRDVLIAACERTIEKNLHLADGENCTLADLVRAVASVKGGAK